MKKGAVIQQRLVTRGYGATEDPSTFRKQRQVNHEITYSITVPISLSEAKKFAKMDMAEREQLSEIHFAKYCAKYYYPIWTSVFFSGVVLGVFVSTVVCLILS